MLAQQMQTRMKKRSFYMRKGGDIQAFWGEK